MCGKAGTSLLTNAGLETGDSAAHQKNPPLWAGLCV